MKVIVTLGPSSEYLLEEIADLGVWAVRTNMSHAGLSFLEMHIETAHEFGMLHITDTYGLNRSGYPIGPIEEGVIKFADERDSDILALSHIYNDYHVDQARYIGWTGEIIGKIENSSAVRWAGKISEVCDYLLIDRGDLARDIGDKYINLAQHNVLRDSEVPVFVAMGLKTIPVPKAIAGVVLTKSTAVGNDPLGAIAEWI